VALNRLERGRCTADLCVQHLSVPEGWERTDLGTYVDERLERAGFEPTAADAAGPALLTGVDIADARGARRGPVTAYATAGISNPAALPMGRSRRRERSRRAGDGRIGARAGTGNRQRHRRDDAGPRAGCAGESDRGRRGRRRRRRCSPKPAFRARRRMRSSSATIRRDRRRRFGKRHRGRRGRVRAFETRFGRRCAFTTRTAMSLPDVHYTDSDVSPGIGRERGVRRFDGRSRRGLSTGTRAGNRRRSRFDGVTRSPQTRRLPPNRFYGYHRNGVLQVTTFARDVHPACGGARWAAANRARQFKKPSRDAKSLIFGLSRVL